MRRTVKLTILLFCACLSSVSLSGDAYGLTSEKVGVVAEPVVECNNILKPCIPIEGLKVTVVGEAAGECACSCTGSFKNPSPEPKCAKGCKCTSYRDCPSEHTWSVLTNSNLGGDCKKACEGACNDNPPTYTMACKDRNAPTSKKGF